jgi:hypothetical protein
MKSFTKIRKTTKGFIGDYVNDAGGNASAYLMNVTSSIIPPMGYDPGYFLIVGILFDQSLKGLFKLLFINECENESRSLLMSMFIDAARRYQVETVYASRGHSATAGTKKKDFTFYNLMHIAATRSRVKWRLMPAPSVDDVLYGMSLVQEYVKESAVERPPDSLYCKRLRNIGVLNRTDPGEVNKLFKDPKLNVFHAVRYILAGIDRDILPMAKPGNIYDLETHRFFKPGANQSKTTPKGESGFFV